jgi:hypothetical protein
MKHLIAILAVALSTTVFAADAPKKAPEAKKAPAAPAAKKEKCVPSKEVVCDKNLQGKTRPTPKKQEDIKTTK